MTIFYLRDILKNDGQFLLSEFMRRSLMIFIIKGFLTFVFIFIVICTTFPPICPPAFVELGSPPGTSNHVLYWIHGGHLFWFR